MSNAIKFRAWSPSAREMIHFGNPIVIADGTDRYGMFLKSMEGKVFIGGEHKLMQYTGLKDKNSVDIFDGDAADGSYINPMTGETIKRIYSVVFENGCYVAKLIGKSPYGDTQLYFVNEKCEVIGNIYENPELLEVEK